MGYYGNMCERHILARSKFISLLMPLFALVLFEEEKKKISLSRLIVTYQVERFFRDIFSHFHFYSSRSFLSVNSSFSEGCYLMMFFLLLFLCY